MKREIYSHAASKKGTLLASFEMVDGELDAEWLNPMLRHHLERDGIQVTDKDGEVTAVKPEDGQAFFDALPLAFANSSLMNVVDQPE